MLTPWDVAQGNATKLNPDGSSPDLQQQQQQQPAKKRGGKLKVGLPPLDEDLEPMTSLETLTLTSNLEYQAAVVCGGPIMCNWLVKLLEPSFG